MIVERVLLLRYPENPAALGLLLWESLGHWYLRAPGWRPKATGRCEALERARVAS